MTFLIANRTGSRGRPRVRQRPDFRLTTRFRYHCDRDLIRALEESPNRNELVRDALRLWLRTQEGV